MVVSRATKSVPLVLAIAGCLLFAFWLLIILPLLTLGLGPAPGREVEAFLVALGAPVAASIFSITGAALGIRRRRATGVPRLSPGGVAYIVVIVVGLAAAAYASLVVRAMLFSASRPAT